MGGKGGGEDWSLKFTDRGWGRYMQGKCLDQETRRVNTALFDCTADVP